MARGFLFAQFFFPWFYAGAKAIFNNAIHKEDYAREFFFVSFNYCFIGLLKYVQRFEFALENSRSELGYSAIYILLLALVVVSRAAYGKLWFVLAVRQKSNCNVPMQTRARIFLNDYPSR